VEAPEVAALELEVLEAAVRVAVAQVAVRRFQELGADLVAAEAARQVLFPEWLPGLRGDPVAVEASRRRKNFLEFLAR
jgi:hypothetical protein